MKKIYMSPVMDIIELKNQQPLLTGSTLSISSDPVGVGDAEAPVFGIDTEVFGEDEMNFFE